MSIPAQGAVGAETMTAGLSWLRLPREQKPAQGFPNRAGEADTDDAIAGELEAAGIEVLRLEVLRKHSGEVKTAVRGELHGWSFKRAWRYWVAEGPGIELAAADVLHAAHPSTVRVNGHCGCPSPREQNQGLAIGSYHVDSPAGLKGLADAIKAIVARAALASPRADSDEPHFGYLFHNPDTGYEWSESHPIESGEVEDAENVRPATAKALHEELIEAWGALEDARADLYTPAQPAGAVPDSLRAGLVEALAQHLHDEEHHLRGCGCWTWPEHADDEGYRGKGGYVTITPTDVQMECREAAERITRRFEQFLASHPAGQSAGSGAGISVDVQTMRASNGTDYYVRIACDGREVTPHCFKERWKAEYEAAHYAWIFGLRSDEPSILAFDPESHPNAPDSTRTGQGEAWVSVPAKATREWAYAMALARQGQSDTPRCEPTSEREIQWAADRINEALAARPAAPETQGAWRERAATEIDAIAQQWGTEGDADGRAYAKTLAAIIRAEHHAPPASSGQEG